MTLARALGYISETPEEDQYRVNVLDRIRELVLSEDDLTIGPDATFMYCWRGGYEELEHRHSPKSGGLHYGGSYHPNDGMCEGQGLCKWCGRTLFGEA